MVGSALGATSTSGLILSLSKDEAAACPVDASSFDKLRMRRMQAVVRPNRFEAEVA